jgi:hypothetical protein
MDHHSQQTSHVPLGGPALACPLMPQADQYFRTHFNVLQAKHKQPNFTNKKKATTSPNSSTKATNDQYNLINKKED